MSRNNYEAAYNRFDNWLGGRVVGDRSVRTYLTELKKQNSKRFVHSTMCELAAILPIRHSNIEWSWIKNEARAYAKEIGLTSGSRGFQAEPFNNGFQVSLPIEEWPQDIQVKWRAFEDISIQKKEHTGALGVLKRSRSARSKQVAIKPVSDEVLKMYKTALKRYFYYLSTQHTGDDWFPDAEKARGFANWITASDVTAGIYLNSLYRALTCLFPDHLQDLLALKEDAQAVISNAEPSRDKTEFLLNPAKIYIKAKNDFYDALSKPRTIRNLTRARNAAMVCFLCIHPLRTKNFVQLTQWDIERERREFQKGDMKGRSPHTVLVPNFLAEVLEVYIGKVKSYFGEHDQLWLANHGDPFKGKGVSRAVRQYMKELMGVAMPIHRFRDAFATYYSERVEEPYQTKMISKGLGHKTEGVTDRHYRNNAEMICDSLKLQRDIECFLLGNATRCQ
ncbi:tyrosine-type recombinase/integrase [Terasakiella pusilla]|uniref:tyrosine-type recombinase/integrase n=1 Tax=Terasakiella pusilla TaxID=64973 RepID=UPI003AA82BBD